MKQRFTLKTLPIACALLATLGGMAQAADYHVYYKVNGISRPKPAPAPCDNPETSLIGTVSQKFCGAEGLELFYAGQAGGHPVLYGMSDDSTSTTWGPTYDVPAIPTTCPSHDCSTGKENTAALLQYPLQAAAQLCASKGEGWYVPAVGEMKLLHTNRPHLDYAALGLSTTVGSWYWTSSEAYGDGAYIANVWSSSTAAHNIASNWKGTRYRLRCAYGL